MTKWVLCRSVSQPVFGVDNNPL